MVDWMAAGKWTVTLEHPLSILLNWLLYEPKLEAVRAGKDTDVSEVHPTKAEAKQLYGATVNDGKLIDDKEEQPSNAFWKQYDPIVESTGNETVVSADAP